MSAAGEPGLLAERRYLRQFDLYRVIAFLGVIGQHAVLWPVPGGSKVGWSLVMVLHATREVFFFLAALLAAYGQLTAPRALVSWWVRRIGMVLVPYLAWTLIYFGYTLASSPVTAPGATFVNDLMLGYYQLYFLVVLFQVYLVLPGLLWLVRRTRGHHGLVFAVSLALQLAMMTISHYFSWKTGVLHAVRHVDLTLIGSRYLTGYQLYVVAGVLAADHFSELQAVVERHSGRILLGFSAMFAITEGYYAYGLSIHQTPGHASDLYQPIVVLWFLTACAGLWAIGWRWADRAARRAPTRADRLVRWGADASGGFYLAHVLVLQLLFTGISSTGLFSSAWGAGSLLLYVGTVAGTGALVGLVLASPVRWVRWVLTGPLRARERAALPSYPPQLADGVPAMAAATASAMAR